MRRVYWIVAFVAVLLLPVGVAVAGARPNTEYAGWMIDDDGDAHEDEIVRVTVNGDATSATFRFENLKMRCGGGTTRFTVTDQATIEDNRARDDSSRVDIRARFIRNKVEGKFVHIGSGVEANCDNPHTRFIARRLDESRG